MYKLIPGLYSLCFTNPGNYLPTTTVFSRNCKRDRVVRAGRFCLLVIVYRGNTAASYSYIGNRGIANIDISAQLFSETDRCPEGSVAIDFDVVSTVL